MHVHENKNVKTYLVTTLYKYVHLYYFIVFILYYNAKIRKMYIKNEKMYKLLTGSAK